MKSRRENTIKLLQQRLQNLESAQGHFQHQYAQDANGYSDDEQVMQPEVLTLGPQHFHRHEDLEDRSFVNVADQSRKADQSPHPTSQRPRTNQAGSTYHQSERNAPTDGGQAQIVERLLREIDALTENLRQKDVKIDTLTFRCEKLQNELTLKLDYVNKLTLQLEDERGQTKHLVTQNKFLEDSIEQT